MLNDTFCYDDDDTGDDLVCRFDIPIGNGMFRNEIISLRDALDGIPPRAWVRSAAERADDLARYAVQAEERAASHVEACFARQYRAQATAWREIADNPAAFPDLY